MKYETSIKKSVSIRATYGDITSRCDISILKALVTNILAKHALRRNISVEVELQPDNLHIMLVTVSDVCTDSNADEILNDLAFMHVLLEILVKEDYKDEK